MPELFKGIRDVVAEWLAAYDAAGGFPKGFPKTFHLSSSEIILGI